jgi:subtilisin family serine protease
VGLVDMERSASFLPEEMDAVPYFFPDALPFADLWGGSTHAAAIVSSNGIHTAGVTSQTRLMAVTVCAFGGYCPYSAVFAGIEHAVSHGADIILMTPSGLFERKPNPYQEEGPGFVSAVNRAINYANKNKVLVISPAGDFSSDMGRNLLFGEYPVPSMYWLFCSSPHTLCVSATGPTGAHTELGPWEDVDAFAPYSNYGRGVIDVAAPGGNSGGGVVAACSSFYMGFIFPPEFGGEPLPGCEPWRTPTVSLASTSTAAAQAAGLAALVIEKFGKDPAQVRNRIEKYADPMGRPGNDPYYGKGRINVYRTMTGK